MGEPSSDDCQMVEEPSPRSISCSDIPDAFLDKVIAKRHFSQFGKIRNFILRPSKRSCIVEYELSDEAETALLDAGTYNGESFDVEYTTKNCPQPMPVDELDPDVRYELDAMAGKRTPSYSTTPRAAVREAMPSRPKPDLRQAKLLKPPTNNDYFAASTSAAPVPAAPNTSQIDRAARIELEAILRKPAFNSEERFAVLDARDKLIRLTTARQTDIKRAQSTKGTCPDMCPEKERLMREAKHQTAAFEEISRNVINHLKAVKEYARSSADQETPLPHELRPEPVLKFTMNYLLRNIMDLCDDPEINISDWFHFVWSRTRSIRKDITQQELCSPGSVLLVEQCARFHVHCAARLIAEEPQVFDQKINTENLTKCLQSLKYMYHDLALKMIRCPNEAEFRAYVVLLNLHDCNFLWEVKQLPADILHSPEIQFALSIYLAMESNNYVKFFSLVRTTTYMNACILLRYFTQVRVKALSIMLKAYVPRGAVTMSISYLTYIMAFEDYEQCILFLEYYGFKCKRDDDTVTFSRESFYHPDMPFILDRAINVVEHKRHTTVGEVVFGAPLESEDEYLKYKPQNSFDDNGYLIDPRFMAKLRAPSNAVRDETVFKIPSALPPVSPRQSGTKTSENTMKLSAKPPDEAKPKPASTNSNSAPNANNIFRKAIQQTLPESNTFVGNLAGPSSKFGGFSFAGGSQPDHKVQADVTDSKPNLFKSATASNNSLPLKSNQIFTSGFGSQGKPPAANNYFSSPPDPTPNATGPSHSKTSIFGNFNSASSSDAQKSSAENENKSNIAFGAQKPLPSIFGGPSITTPTAFGGFKASVPPIKGIVSVASNQDDKEKQAAEERKKLELEQKLKHEEDERKRKIADAKKAEDERERKAVEERKAKIETLSADFCAEFIEQLLNEVFIFELAEEELNRFKAFEETLNELHAAIIDEIVGEMLKELMDEEIEKRKGILSTPFWMPTKSIPQQVPELQHPLQSTTLNFMKRYLKGVSSRIRIPTLKTESINLWKSTAPEILRAVSEQQRHVLIKSHVYWKCVISVPDKTEDASFEGVNRWLDNVFTRQNPIGNDVFFAEQNTVAEQTVCLCMRKLSGREMLNENGERHRETDTRGTNAVLVFMSSDKLQAGRLRLESVLRRTGVRDAIGIVVYNSGSHNLIQMQDDLNMVNQPDLQTASPCFFGDTVRYSLVQLIDNCLQCIGSKSQFDIKLELQQTPSFLQLCLGNDFWERLISTLTQNPTMERAVAQFDFVANFYNEGLRRLMAACSHSVQNNLEFPVELKKFVPETAFDIPLDIEYFPQQWKSSHHRNTELLVNFLKSLEVKTLPISHITDVSTLEKSVLAFARSHVTTEQEACQAGYKMFQQILLQFNQLDNEPFTFAQKMESCSWIRPIQSFTSDVLTIRYNDYVARKQLPDYVIYDKQELVSFTRSPWWLTLKKNLLKEITSDVLNQSDRSEDEENDLPRNKKRKMDDLSLEYLDLSGDSQQCVNEAIAKGLASIENADRKIATFKKLNRIGKEVSKELDHKLYKQEQQMRIRNNVWDQRLND